MREKVVELTKKFLNSEHAKWQFFRHAAVGGSGVIVNYFLFLTLREHYGFSTLQASLIVHVVLISYIFPLQKYFTFSSSLESWGQIRRFLINDMIYISMDFTMSWFFIDWLGLHSWLGKFIALALLTPMSFMIQKHWVFDKNLPAEITDRKLN